MLTARIQSAEYWRAVAQAIDAEDAKATLFIKHKPSIGTAREEILKDFLRRNTPEPYRVRSGFIHRPQVQTLNDYCSPQLDVVVYDASNAQPDYEIGQLVVVPGGSFGSAVSIVEVKTYLDNQQFNSILEAWEHVTWLQVPTFGYAFDGVQFSTFVDYITNAIKQQPLGIPDCIAVHRANYLFVREGYTGQPRNGWHSHAKLQLAVNFGDTMPGLAAGTLLQLYLDRLRSPIGFNHLKHWFNNLQVPIDSKLSFSDEGAVTTGNLPD
jgi:hypothetical protein